MSVITGYSTQVSHADDFCFDAKHDTTSQPVNAWNTVRAFDFSGPSDSYLKFYLDKTQF